MLLPFCSLIKPPATKSVTYFLPENSKSTESYSAMQDQNIAKPPGSTGCTETFLHSSQKFREGLHWEHIKICNENSTEMRQNMTSMLGGFCTKALL